MLNQPEDRLPALVVTGPVGAGKSTTMNALSELLQERGIPHAAIDMDCLRWVYPSPPGDPFASQIGWDNLAAIWPNLQTIGPRCVVIADVVERRDQSRQYRAAMPGVDVTVVRLDVPMEVILRRLERRESEQTIDWYRHRAPELQEIMERNRIGDLVINVGDRSPQDIAIEILERAGLTQGQT